MVDGEKLRGVIQLLVEPIKGAFSEAKALHPKSDRTELVRETVRLNVARTTKTLSAGPLAEAVRAGRLQIKGGIYDLETSRVAWL